MKTRPGCLLVLLAFGLAPAIARACLAPPAHVHTHHTELVARAETIVLARVVGPESLMQRLMWRDRWSGRRARFEVMEVLRGRVKSTFSIRYGILGDEQAYRRRDFDEHREGRFWDERITRAPPERALGLCEAIPVFYPGRIYLVFLGPSHLRSYEEIRSPRDLWLRAVRRLIADPSLASGLSLPFERWLERPWRVFLGRITSCKGPTFSVEAVHHGEVESTWRRSRWIGPSGLGAGCEVGDRYVVIDYSRDMDPDHDEMVGSFRKARMLPVREGTVDFSAVLEHSEADVQGPTLWRLEDIPGFEAAQPAIAVDEER